MKNKSKTKVKFKSSKYQQVLPALVVALAIAAIGLKLLLGSHAATPSTAAGEAESGTKAGTTSTVADSAASGGNALKFGTAAVSSNPSGVAMPTGNTTVDGHTWTPSFSDDFTSNFALGSWYSSSYVTSGRWSSYDGPDTCGKGACGSSSVYNPTDTLSASGGMLDMYIHTTSSGVHETAGPSPNNQNMTYGLVSIRFKTSTRNLAGFKTAWLWWPTTYAWTDEIDFPEGDLSGTIGGFGHCYSSSGSASSNCAQVGSNAYYDSWHTATLAWMPGKVDFILDGQSLGTQTSGVSAEQMYYVLQTESCFDDPGACPNNSEAGHLDIDWFVMYKY